MNIIAINLNNWVFNDRVDMDSKSVKVGMEEVVSVRLSQQHLECQWKNGWGEWDELQNSPELAELQKRADETLRHVGSKGKGKDKRS